jgi:hypothetical protein
MYLKVGMVKAFALARVWALIPRVVRTGGSPALGVESLATASQVQVERRWGVS